MEDENGFTGIDDDFDDVPAHTVSAETRAKWQEHFARLNEQRKNLSVNNVFELVEFERARRKLDELEKVEKSINRTNKVIANAKANGVTTPQIHERIHGTARLNAQRRLKYKASNSWYREQHEAQQGKCALCGMPETMLGNGGQPRQLSIDHDHTNGKLRKLLCTRCNWLVGHFERHPQPDKAELFKQFYLYLAEVCDMPLDWI